MGKLRGIYVGTASGIKEALDIYKGIAEDVAHSWHKKYLIKEGVLQEEYAFTYSGAEALRLTVENGTNEDTKEYILRITKTLDDWAETVVTFTCAGAVEAEAKYLIVEYDAETWSGSINRIGLTVGETEAQKELAGFIQADNPAEGDLIITLTLGAYGSRVAFGIKNLYVVY